MKISKGSVFKRKGSPFLYLNISIDGKRHVEKTSYYHNEIDKVKNEVLPILRAKLLTGEIVLNKEEKEKKTFEYYSEIFINSKKYLKHGTSIRYINTIERYDKVFKGREIKSITALEIENYLYSLNIKSLTFRNYLLVLKGVFKKAVLDDEISVNPCTKIDVPKNQIVEIEPFSVDEVNLIINNAEGWFKNFIATAFYTGARIGELFALKWQNIDLKKKRIYINATRGDYKEGVPKNGKNRYIPIFNSLMPFLVSQKKITGLNSYVFLTERGCNLRGSNTARFFWYPLLRRLNLPKKKIYNTRHTFATNMITSGHFSLNQIASWLGHSNIRMLVLHYNKFINSELDNFNSEIDVFCSSFCDKDSQTA